MKGGAGLPPFATRAGVPRVSAQLFQFSSDVADARQDFAPEQVQRRQHRGRVRSARGIEAEIDDARFGCLAATGTDASSTAE